MSVPRKSAGSSSFSPVLPNPDDPSPRQSVPRSSSPITDRPDLGSETEYDLDVHHDDPSAGIILQCDDGSEVRVHTWYLQRKSGFVDDLLSLPTPRALHPRPTPRATSPEAVAAAPTPRIWISAPALTYLGLCPTPTPPLIPTPKETPATVEADTSLSPSPPLDHTPVVIPVDASSNIAHAYVSLLYCSCLHSDLTISDLRELLDLCDRMQSPSFIPFILDQITARASVEPWNAIIYASKTQDLALARVAIAAFDDTPDEDCPVRYFPRFEKKDLEGLRASWVTELFKLKYGENGGHMTRSRGKRIRVGEYNFNARDIGRTVGVGRAGGFGRGGGGGIKARKKEVGTRIGVKARLGKVEVVDKRAGTGEMSWKEVAAAFAPLTEGES